MFGFQPWQLILVVALAFLFFGNRLPSVMRSLGRSVVEFKKGVNGIEDDLDAAMKSDEKKESPKQDSAL